MAFFRPAWIRFALVALAAGALNTTPARSADLAVDILPSPLLLAGEPFAVVIRGGVPGTEVVLETRAIDFFGDTWSARNVYLFDVAGTVDPGRQPPFEGSYEGVDALGPFWSMKRSQERLVQWGFGKYAQQLPQFFFTRDGVNRVSLRATLSDGTSASATAEFATTARGVTQRAVSDAALVGTWVTPNLPPPWPVVVVPGGRFGYRTAQTIALRLASQGYATLALAFTGVEDLPPPSNAVPLEYFDGAVLWVKRQPNVAADKVALLGIGPDAGLVLLLAARNPTAFAAVVAANPHSVVFPRQSGSPWTEDGRLWPHVPLAYWDDDFARTGHNYYILEKSLVLFEEAVAAARTPVERIESPVLLLSGADDWFQPSERMAREIADAMTDAGHGARVRHLNYADAGPTLNGDGIGPTTPGAVRFGGTPQGNSAAQFAAWRTVFAFLDEVLR
ncbi:MAG: acyl-CoA thioesterase/bile acid-CoA:amino acid N-acyltransferase family protein [Alphaproteobacteria bacterium]